MKQTKYCKKCFHDDSYNSLHSLINLNYFICNKCLKNMNPIFYEFKFENIRSLAIYRYNDELRNVIYLLKGCYDYELRDILILPFRLELSLRYFGYTLIPIPSIKENDEKRGFNHVEAIFSPLNLNMIKCLYKTKNINQHQLNYKERIEGYNKFRIDENIDLKNKKILLVDDIMTTGETLKSCLELIKSKHPKNIKILILAKRFKEDYEKEKLKKHKIIKNN